MSIVTNTLLFCQALVAKARVISHTVVMFIFKRNLIRLILLAVFLIGTVFLSTNTTYAQSGRDCPDPTDGWYDCWQKLSTVDKYVNTWCSGADAKKTKSGDTEKSDIERCREALLNKSTGVNYSPTGLRVSDQCKSGGAEALKVKSTCWVLIRTGSPWYDDLQKFGEDCTFEAPTSDCSATVITEFLESNNWAANSDENSGGSSKAINTNDSAQKSAFMKRITIYLRWLIVGIGILSVFGLVIAGIQYSAAQENPQSVAAAKTRINNIIIGILIYLTMFGMLQWLIPGGIFSF